MKNELIKIIRSIIELLIECNWIDKANWFKEKLETIERSDEGSEEFIIILREIKKIIAGMGSFTDLPMIPKQNSKLSKGEARLKHFDLAEQLDKVIIVLLEKYSG